MVSNSTSHPTLQEPETSSGQSSPLSLLDNLILNDEFIPQPAFLAWKIPVCLHLIVHTGAELHGQRYSYQGGEDWESQPIVLNNLPGMGALTLLSPGKSQPTWATVNEILPVKPSYYAKRTRNTV